MIINDQKMCLSSSKIGPCPSLCQLLFGICVSLFLEPAPSLVATSLGWLVEAKLCPCLGPVLSGI